MELKSKAYLYLVVSLLSGASLPVILSFAKGAVLVEFLLFAYALSIPTAFILIKAQGKSTDFLDIFKDRKKLLLMVITGIVTFFPIEYGIGFAERYVSASLATAIFRTAPLLMLLLIPYMLRERLTKYQIGALMRAFAGLYIGVSSGNVFGLFQNSDAGIVAFLVGLALCYALSIVLIKKYLFDVSTLLAVSSIIMFGLFVLLFFAGGAQLYTLSTLQLFLVYYVGIFFNVFSFYMYFSALKPLKSTLVANVYMLSPFITFIFAAAVLGEAIQPYYLAIAGLVGAGIFIQTLDRKGSSYIASTKSERVSRMTIFDVTGVFSDTGEIALANTIKDGGRILAINLPDTYTDHVAEMSESKHYKNVYTDSDESIPEESRFVKDIVGTKEGEFVVMKAGLVEECEKFFEELHKKIEEKK